MVCIAGPTHRSEPPLLIPKRIQIWESPEKMRPYSVAWGFWKVNAVKLERRTNIKGVHADVATEKFRYPRGPMDSPVRGGAHEKSKGGQSDREIVAWGCCPQMESSIDNLNANLAIIGEGGRPTRSSGAAAGRFDHQSVLLVMQPWPLYLR